MRELNTTEVAQVSGAGFIKNTAENVGTSIGKLFFLGSFGGKVGKAVGTVLELIPGSGIVNCIMGHIFPAAKEPAKPEATPAPEA